MTVALIASMPFILTGAGSIDAPSTVPAASGIADSAQDRPPRGTGNGQPPSDRDKSRDRSRERDTKPGADQDRTDRGKTGRATEADRGWIILFDGSNLDHWRGFKQESTPDGWTSTDRGLCRVASAGDLVTKKQFENFDLRLEWKIAPGGNSGIMWRASEDRSYPWETAPEMQILDNDAHRDGLDPKTSAGADYAMYAPEADAVKPAGQWNDVRILVQGPKVTYWLNGQRIVHYELWSEDWEQRVKTSKFASMPGYGRNTRGHIALQDHGDEVCFRNIRIRELPAEARPSRDGT